MSSLEEIGALLGLVAFAGLAVLVFLTFQQARHVRRLRDWAGRAPERAAAMAAREVEGEETQLDRETPEEAEPERTRAFDRLRTRAGHGWAEIDRRSPADPRLLLGGLAAVILGVAIATGGFGLLDDGGSKPERAGGGGDKQRSAQRSARVEVAVLNGTAPPGGTGVPGAADQFSADVKDAGFKVGAVDNAGSFATSTVMYAGGDSAEADKLASALDGVLSSVTVERMTPEIEQVAAGADLALIIGQSDAPTTGSAT